MADLFTFANLGNLGVLIFLQAVLGFDNLLYISIESARAPLEKQKRSANGASSSPLCCELCCCLP